MPVDSEHSALAQCLRGGRADEVHRLVLTASGGPFRGRARAELSDVTPAQALAHPTWSMGPLVTVNSATLVNKGLEVVEAHLLFGLPSSLPLKEECHDECRLRHDNRRCTQNVGAVGVPR